MLGGVTVNVILAIIIFIFILWVWGEKYVPISNVKYGLYVDSLGKKIGMIDGDRITAVGGKPVEKVGTVGTEIVMNEPKSITIDRQGQIMELPIPKGFVGQLNKNKLGGFTYVRVPRIIDTIFKDAKIQGGTLQKGDSLINFAGTPIAFNTDLPREADDYKDTTVALSFLRNGKDTINVSMYIDKKGRTFVGYKSMFDLLGYKHIKYSFWESIPAGWNRCWETLGKYVKNLKQLFTSDEIKVRDSLGSVFSIGGAYPGEWDWQGFWLLTAVFSIILAFMNVLPIPALDGGHALFTFYEMVTGHKPSDKFMEYAQMVGMILLLGLMAYALGLDISRWFK